MSNPVAVSSSYPKDNLSVATVLCIGAEDDQIGAADVLTIRNLGCATDRVITSSVSDDNEFTTSMMKISSWTLSINQSLKNSIKIGTLSDLESIKEVQLFLQSVADKNYPVIVDLTNENSSKNELLWAISSLILPRCTVLIISYDIACRLLTLSQSSVENIAYHLVVFGVQTVIIEMKSAQCYVMINKNGNLSDISSFWLPNYCNNLNQKIFSAAIAAYMTYDRVSPSYAIYFAHHYSSVEQRLRSLLLRIQPLSFTQEFWSSVDSIYRRILQLPFITKMLDDSLDERIYDYYIVQEYVFLLDRGSMLRGLVEQCTDNEVREFFTIQLQRSDSSIATFFSDSEMPTQDEAEIKKMPACYDYTKLMLQLAQPSKNSGWQEGFIALLPCSLIYAKVADWMIASGKRPTVKRYAKFIDSYFDQGKRDRLIYFLELTDRVISSCSHEKRRTLKKLFQQVCEYEFAFWNDAYHYGTQQVNK